VTQCWSRETASRDRLGVSPSEEGYSASPCSHVITLRHVRETTRRLGRLSPREGTQRREDRSLPTTSPVQAARCARSRASTRWPASSARLPPVSRPSRLDGGRSGRRLRVVGFASEGRAQAQGARPVAVHTPAREVTSTSARARSRSVSLSPKCEVKETRTERTGLGVACEVGGAGRTVVRLGPTASRRLPSVRLRRPARYDVPAPPTRFTTPPGRCCSVAPKGALQRVSEAARSPKRSSRAKPAATLAPLSPDHIGD
jgi:hypothetical protein